MRQHNPRKLRQPRARLQNYTPSSKAKICTCSEAYEQANKQIWLRDSKIEKLIRHVNYLNQRIYGSSSERISHKIQDPVCEQLVLPFLIPVDEQLPSDQLGGQIHDTQAESKRRDRVRSEEHTSELQ